MTSINKISITLTTTLLLSSLATSAWSQDDAKTLASNQTLSPLFNCADISSDTDRLICQDREIQKLRQATETKKLVIIDEEAAKDIKKKSFGFSLPKLGLPEFGGDSDKPEAVALTIASVTNSGRKLTIKMKNGQIWQSIESYVGYLPKRGELTAKIKPASFGSFRMTISNEKTKSKGIRVRRLE